jgi:NitT/TauT family transport system substrate-binding protein
MSPALARRTGWLALTAVLNGALLTSCGQGTRVDIPVAGWPGFEYFYLAQEKKLGKPEQLTIKALEFGDPQEITEAYAQAKLDIAQLTTVEAVDLCERVPERCPVVVLILDESRGGDMVVVRPAIGSLAGLRGKRVGIAPSTLGPYVLSRALAREGMTLADVRVVSIPLSAAAPRLASGEIDGVALYPPFSDGLLQSGLAIAVFDSSEIPGEIFDVLVVDPTFYSENTALLGRLLRVWQAAHDLARRDPTAAEIMGAREQISGQAFRESEAGLVYFPLAEQKRLLAPQGPLVRNLEAVQAVQRQLGLISGSAALPSVSLEPLRQALQ